MLFYSLENVNSIKVTNNTTLINSHGLWIVIWGLDSNGFFQQVERYTPSHHLSMNFDFHIFFLYSN